MKKTGRSILCLLLAAVMLLGVLPVIGMAAEEETPYYDVAVTAKYYANKSQVGTGGTTCKIRYITVADSDMTLTVKSLDHYITVGNKIYECVGYLVGTDTTIHRTLTIPAYTGDAAWEEKWQDLTAVYLPHTHKFIQTYNRHDHWKVCDCGKITDKEPHVDPAEDEDKICTCGYKFSDNADLTMLWFANIRFNEQFRKDTTEYTAGTVTYLDVTSTQITAKTFDGMATVQLPEDTTVKEGVNKFEITVTAEDKAHTKTYTVIVTKSAKVDNTEITSVASYEDDGTTTAAPRTVINKHGIAVAEITAAAGEKLTEQAAANESVQVILAPTFQKWSAKAVEITIPGATLAAISQDTDADLVVSTCIGIVTIPNDVLADIAQGGESVTIAIQRAAEPGLTITADGEDITVSAA